MTFNFFKKASKLLSVDLILSLKLVIGLLGGCGTDNTAKNKDKTVILLFSLPQPLFRCLWPRKRVGLKPI